MAESDPLIEFCGWLSTRTGTVMGASLWANVQPDDSTGPALFVFEIQSIPAHLLLSTGLIGTPRYEILARSTEPTQGDYPVPTAVRALARSAWRACHALADVKLGPSSAQWIMANPEQEPFLEGRDNHNRLLFSFKVACERQS